MRVARALGDFSCDDGIFMEPDVKAFARRVMMQLWLHVMGDGSWVMGYGE
jgi:hypothetical protein